MLLPAYYWHQRQRARQSHSRRDRRSLRLFIPHLSKKSPTIDAHLAPTDTISHQPVNLFVCDGFRLRRWGNGSDLRHRLAVARYDDFLACHGAVDQFGQLVLRLSDTVDTHAGNIAIWWPYC